MIRSKDSMLVFKTCYKIFGSEAKHQNIISGPMSTKQEMTLMTINIASGLVGSGFGSLCSIELLAVVRRLKRIMAIETLLFHILQN